MCLSGKKVAEGSCFPVIFAYIWQQITNKKYNFLLPLFYPTSTFFLFICHFNVTFLRKLTFYLYFCKQTEKINKLLNFRISGS